MQLIRWVNKLGLASIQYEPAEGNAPAECYSEASDHEEAETTDIPPPPPPYSEQTLQDPVDASGPPGSTHQMFHLVEFQSNKAVAVVPENWRCDGVTYWPNYRSDERVDKAVKHVEEPGPDWKTYDIRIIKSCVRKTHVSRAATEEEIRKHAI